MLKFCCKKNWCTNIPLRLYKPGTGTGVAAGGLSSDILRISGSLIFETADWKMSSELFSVAGGDGVDFTGSPKISSPNKSDIVL